MKPILGILLILSAQVLSAADTDGIRTANLEFVHAWHLANKQAAESSSQLTALPNVLIDYSAKSVSFYAEATGITSGEAIEFFLIGEKSGNAYESIAVALAEPKDIAEGIKALGLPTGRSAAPVALQFWPKGERVVMTFNGRRAEQLLIDTRTQNTLPTQGLVFTASSFVIPDGEVTEQLAAQVKPPFSIASNYNEQNSILDVPWQAPQTAVYSKQALNPKQSFKPGERIFVVITPEYPDGKRRVQNLTLLIGAVSVDSARPTLADAQFTLINRTDGSMIVEKCTLDILVKDFSAMIDQGQDPFVEIHVDPATPLAILHDAAAIFKGIDSEKGIRIEAPPEGTLYYQAFTPDEQLRERKNRYIQPWELRIESTNKATLTRIDEHWITGVAKPTTTIEDMTIVNPEEMVPIMTTQNPDVRGLFVYAPPTLAHGELMRFLTPVIKTHPMIHVYLQKTETIPHDQISCEDP